eukprot:6300595-Prymnesium_polylepis.1
MSESPCLNLEDSSKGGARYFMPNTRRHRTHQPVSEPKISRNNLRIDRARCSQGSLRSGNLSYSADSNSSVQ